MELLNRSRGLGRVLGSATGEEDHDPVPGGWEGTDDATSTAPSDLAQPVVVEKDPEDAIADFRGAKAEGTRDWEHESLREI